MTKKEFSITNPDMARNFEDYPIENLQIPTLIFHAKDDKLASYNDTERVETMRSRRVISKL